MLIEDAAEAIGATFDGQPVGTFGTAGFYSFNGNKVITASSGGIILTKDSELAQKCRYLSNQAKDPGMGYIHSETGFNYRLSNILAAIGRAQLTVLDERIAQRRAIFERYREGFSDLPELRFLPEPSWGKSTRWLSCFLLETSKGSSLRDKLINHLEEHNIESRPLWKPMHQQKLFTGKPVYGGEISDHLYRNGICLPSSSHLTPDDQNRVIQIVRDFLQSSEKPHPSPTGESHPLPA